MYQFNLCNNDIIIILVLFFVFCVFLYMTNTKKKENFNNDIPFEINYKNKLNTKNSFKKFFSNIITYTDSLIIMNDNYINILDALNSPNSSNSPNNISINGYIDNIENAISKISTTSFGFKQPYQNPIDEEFNKLINNLNDLFNSHKELFDSHNNESESESESEDEYNCNKLDSSVNPNFYKNLKNQVDVIESNNIGQLKLIKINIDNIKSIINKLNFKEEYRTELQKVFDNYNNLFNNMYNKNSTNIFYIINDTCYNTTANDNYDKSKLYINQQNLKLINKSFEKLKNEFYYFESDKLFITKDSANDHFNKTKAGLNLWQSFCEKLKKLNKPNKTNLVLKKFNLDLIEKKKKYVKELENTIFNIQNNMTKYELQQYNINKIRTHDQANKQYKVIKKGIENLKNKNKIKINLT